MARFRRGTRLKAEMAGESAQSDVAFLLLIFFIVSTTFPEIGLTLILPSKASTVKQVKRTNVMQIVTARGGDYFIDTDETPTPLSELRELVKERLKENDKLILSMETHPEAPYGSMVDALDEVTLAYNDLERERVRRDKRISLKRLEIEE